MSEKPKYNYQATAEVHIHNLHICVNGVGDTMEAAMDLFDHALESIPEIIKSGGDNIDGSQPIAR